MKSIYPSRNLGIRDISCSGSEVGLSELMILHQMLPQNLNSPVQARSLIQRGYTNFYERKCALFLTPGSFFLAREKVYDTCKEWHEDATALAFFSLRYASKVSIGSESSVHDFSMEDRNLVLCQFIAEYRNYYDDAITQREEKEMTTLMGNNGLGYPDSLKTSAYTLHQHPADAHFLEFHSASGKSYIFESQNEQRGISVRIRLNPVPATATGITQIRVLRENFPTDNAVQTWEHLGSSAYHRMLMEHYLVLDVSSFYKPKENKLIVQGTTTMHHILLDKKQQGRIYCNGRFVTEYSRRHKSIATQYPGLFGYDLIDSLAVNRKNGKLEIVDYNRMMLELSSLIQEVLVDANQKNKNFVGKLLSRIMHGHDDDDWPSQSEKKAQMDEMKSPCLESEIMSSHVYDPVGISSKALATYFEHKYGNDAYPCLQNDVCYVKERIGPHRIPIAVPQRALDVLYRGGFTDLSTTEKNLWFVDIGNHMHFHSLGPLTKSVVQDAVSLIQKSEMEVVTNIATKGITTCNKIVLVKCAYLFGTNYEVNHYHKFMCRYNESDGKFYVNDAAIAKKSSTKSVESNELRKRSFLLGLYIAQQHDNPLVLSNYFESNACP